MTEKNFATQRQMRKLFAVLRNNGLDPEEYVKTLKEWPLTRSQVSKLIDQFENHRNEKTEVAEVAEVVEEEKEKNEVGEELEEGNGEEKRRKEVLEALGVNQARLNKIDVVLSECIDRVTKIVSNTLAKTEPTQAILIFELTKLYLNEVRKGAERG